MDFLGLTSSPSLLEIFFPFDFFNVFKRPFLSRLQNTLRTHKVTIRASNYHHILFLLYFWPIRVMRAGSGKRGFDCVASNGYFAAIEVHRKKRGRRFGFGLGGVSDANAFPQREGYILIKVNNKIRQKQPIFMLLFLSPSKEPM